MSSSIKRPNVIQGLTLLDQYSVGNLPKHLVHNNKILTLTLVAIISVEFNGLSNDKTIEEWLETEQGHWVAKHGYQTSVIELQDVTIAETVLRICTYLTPEKITFYTIKFCI